MEKERSEMGWNALNIPNYVLRINGSNEEHNRCIKLINDSDIVIIGSAPFKLINKRIKDGKLVFKYSERVFKNIKTKIEYPLRMLKYIRYGGLKSHINLLCASAYAQRDFNRMLCFRNRCYKWGYFPEFIEYSEDERKARRDERRSGCAFSSNQRHLPWIV